MRNRTIHKCDLTNVCNVLEINIEFIPLKNEGGHSRVEHDPSPYLEFQREYNIGLVNNHYFTNDTTDLTAYSLEHYDEVKDTDNCYPIYKENGKYYNKDKSGKGFIKAFYV